MLDEIKSKLSDFFVWYLRIEQLPAGYRIVSFTDETILKKRLLSAGFVVTYAASDYQFMYGEYDYVSTVEFHAKPRLQLLPKLAQLGRKAAVFVYSLIL